MAKITWDAVGERRFEAGVDHGVLYPPTGPGVPWNGLLSVNQRTNTPTFQKYYMDGELYLNEVTSEDFAGDIEAFTYPEELDYLTGFGVSVEGFLFDSQPSKPFGLSYRTLVGNDTKSTELGYKIHLVYNALAIPGSNSANTLTENPTPETFTWTFESKPMTISGFKPTAHLVFDSTIVFPGVMKSLEDILYGAYGTQPRLPTISEILGLKNSFDLVRINENAISGLSPLVISSDPDLIGDLDTGYFTETRPTRLKPMPKPGINDLET